jgi:hypothetical protein
LFFWNNLTLASDTFYRQNMFNNQFFVHIVLFLALSGFNLQVSAQPESLPGIYEFKFAPPVLENLLKSTTSDYRILIKKVNNSDKWIERNLSGIEHHRKAFENVIYLYNIDLGNLLFLSKNDTVLFIDIASRKAQEEKILDSLDLSVNSINKLHKEYPEIKGKSMVLSIKERPFDTLDVDFYKRVLFKSKITNDLSAHATSMATIAAGAGNSGIKGLGVAPEAFIVSASYEDLSPENSVTLLNEEVSVQNHSYGVGEIENYYGIESQLYDLQTLEIPHLLHVFSSGNIGNKTPETDIFKGIEGHANLTGQFKSSKNSICVGSVNKYVEENNFSCKGPTADGRLKPEVVAFGANGTSDAAALVSGVSVLLQNAYYSRHRQLPPSELIKSALINSTCDIGNKGPDYATGYGSINAFEAIKMITDTNFYIGSISSNDKVEYQLEVPENTDMLKVTLVWKDPAGLPGARKVLINDLDLQISHIQSSETYLPWVLSSFPDIDSLKSQAVRKKDTLNNVEQITIDQLHPGSYRIIVQASNNIDNQQYCLTYNLQSFNSEWIYPLSTNKLLAGEDILLRWGWTDQPGIGILEYKKVNDSSWQTIQENTDLQKGSYKWLLPKINSQIQFRIRTPDKAIVSDTILLSEAVLPKVGFNCDDELMLYWANIKSANSYNLWQLGNEALKKKTNLTDTVIVLKKDEINTKHYAISAVFNNFEGLRGNSLNYENQSINCYIKSFYPLFKVTHQKAQLQLELASTYDLKAISLQRLDNNTFNYISTLSPLDGPNITFEDNQPKKNSNTYRICIEKNDGKIMFSHEEIIFYNKPEEIFVYPNPVMASGFLNIINNDNKSDINIYNMSGQLVRRYKNIQGSIKSIDISQVKSGFYILENISSTGKICRKKIVVVR